MKTVFALCLVFCSVAFTQRIGPHLSFGRSPSPGPRPPRRGEYCVWEQTGCRKIPPVSRFVVRDAAEDIAPPLEVAVVNADYATDFDVAVLSISFSGEVTKAYANIIMSHYNSYYDRLGGSACAFTKASDKVTAAAMSLAVRNALTTSSSERVRSMYLSFSKTVYDLSIAAIRKAFNGACEDFDFVYVYRHLHTGEFTADVAIAFAEALYHVNLEQLGNYGY